VIQRNFCPSLSARPWISERDPKRSWLTLKYRPIPVQTKKSSN